jgi:aspartyl/asparaginyl-tRNA synthetase
VDWAGLCAFGLTVGGQLEGEAFACALENLHLRADVPRGELKHFPARERILDDRPEMAFTDLRETWIAEETVKYLSRDIKTNCAGPRPVLPNLWTRVDGPARFRD